MKYVPHDYQAYATQFILDHPVAAVLLDMGLGKSVITLTAIHELCLERFEVRKVLVIAPEDTLGVSRTERDVEKLQLLWAQGYQMAVERMEEIRGYLNP